jgi:carbon monoxide dehydrogenase subunit G
MATVRKEIDLNVPAEKVWEVLSDFQHVHTRLAPGFVTNSVPAGGTVRMITFANGSTAKETLVTMDSGRRRLVYVVSSEKLTHHNASAEVVATAAGRCRFVWTTDFLPDALATYIDSQMNEGAAAMKVALEKD